MNAPRRWLDDTASSTPFERDLLRSARDVEPPAGAQAAVFAALAAKIGPGGGGGGGGGGSATVASGSAAAGATAAGLMASQAPATGVGLGKVALLGLAGALVIGGAWLAFGRSSQANETAHAGVAPTIEATTRALADDAAARAASDAQSRATANATSDAITTNDDARPRTVNVPVAPPRQDATAAPSSKVPESAATMSASDLAAARASQLREEAAMVTQAREALRSGDPKGALAVLEQARVKLGAGQLSQEREALAIEALAKSGNRAAAAKRAKAFVDANPTSPLSSKLSVYVDP